MSRRKEIVVGALSDDDLLLPRPPGVFRRFWSQHPLFADILIALAAFLLSAPTLTLRSGSNPTHTSPSMIWLTFGFLVLSTIGLLFRRRLPVIVFVIAAAPVLALPPILAGVTQFFLPFSVYAVAVYRSSKAAWVCFAAFTGTMGIFTLISALGDPDTAVSFIVNLIIATTMTLFGTLVGTNVGNRRRYLLALIDRSRQLAIERDQQAQLATAAERTRIAREMHDIVSHSLTVVVALSEGAMAATSIERAREASQATAETARSALSEMRSMLGVLRDPKAEEATPLVPLEAVDPTHIVSSAQRAGFPVVLETKGSAAEAPRAVRFALGRVVQEGVTNAMRHAPNATSVVVRIAVESKDIHVSVRNDGAITPPPGHKPGFGLRGISERVEQLGGVLEAGATPGGWQIHAVLPLTPPTSEEPS